MQEDVPKKIENVPTVAKISAFFQSVQTQGLITRTFLLKLLVFFLSGHKLKKKNHFKDPETFTSISIFYGPFKSLEY